jgi:glutathione peroxidase
MIAFYLADGFSRRTASTTPARKDTDVLDYTLTRIDGQEDSLTSHLGNVLLLVNIASECGYTYQYQGLQALYERFHDRGFEVLGFPANDFGAQEPGTNEQIAQFCQRTYGVSFPMFAKISVRGGSMHPLYAELTSQPAPVGGPVLWNFQKYLVDRAGNVVAKFSTETEPDDPQIVAAIEQLLAASAPDR